MTLPPHIALNVTHQFGLDVHNAADCTFDCPQATPSARLGIPKTAWVKASASASNGQCVELAPFGRSVAVRDSKDPAGPVLVFGAEAWRGLLDGARSGKFDLERLGGAS